MSLPGRSADGHRRPGEPAMVPAGRVPGLVTAGLLRDPGGERIPA